jgi:hypothetical protein
VLRLFPRTGVLVVRFPQIDLRGKDTHRTRIQCVSFREVLRPVTLFAIQVLTRASC